MFGKEPTVVLGAISEIIRQIVPMLIIFGLIHWTVEQVAAFMLVVGALIGFFTIVLTRSQTVATQVANSQIQTAIDSPSTATVPQVIAKEKAANQ